MPVVIFGHAVVTDRRLTIARVIVVGGRDAIGDDVRAAASSALNTWPESVMSVSKVRTFGFASGLVSRFSTW